MPTDTGGAISKIRRGPVKLTYNNLAIGHTVGGVTLAVTNQNREVFVDEFGSNLADLIYTGDRVTVRCTVPEYTIQVLGIVYPYSCDKATYRGIGRSDVHSGQAEAKTLILHPIREGASTAYDVTIWKAIVREVGDVLYGPEGDSQYPVTFEALVDETRADGERLLKIGSALAT